MNSPTRELAILSDIPEESIISTDTYFYIDLKGLHDRSVYLPFKYGNRTILVGMIQVSQGYLCFNESTINKH